MKHKATASRTAETMNTTALVELATKIAFRVTGPRKPIVIIVATSTPIADAETRRLTMKPYRTTVARTSLEILGLVLDMCCSCVARTLIVWRR